MKLYTKTGDQGSTSLLGGERVPKNHPRIEAYGSIDELNSFIGLILCDSNINKKQNLTLKKCQHYLFNIGSHLACNDESLSSKLPSLTTNLIYELENNIDEMTAECEPLKNFILPGGSQTSSYSHIARCICRRTERLCCEIKPINSSIIPFLNRLSDYLFCYARFANKEDNQPDILWSQTVE